MAAALVQSASGSNGGSGNYQVNLASPSTFGNLLVVCVGGYKENDLVDFPDINDNVGSSNYPVGLDYQVTTADRLTIYYQPLCPAGIQTIFLRQTAPSSAVVMEYSGLLSQVDQVGTAMSQTDTGGIVTWNTPAIRTNVNPGVLIAMAVAINVSPSGFAGAGGFSLVLETDIVSQSVSLGVIHQLNGAPAVYSPNGTVNASMQVDATCIAFK